MPERSVRLDLALRAIAAEQSLQADEEDIDAELERLTTTEDRDADQLREEMAEADGLARLKSGHMQGARRSTGRLKLPPWSDLMARLLSARRWNSPSPILHWPTDVPTEGDSADDSRDLSDDHS